MLSNIIGGIAPRAISGRGGSRLFRLTVVAEKNLDNCTKACDDYMATEKGHGRKTPMYRDFPSASGLDSSKVDWKKYENKDGQLDWDGWQYACYDECWKKYKTPGATNSHEIRDKAKAHRDACARDAADNPAPPPEPPSRRYW